jgi:hypothetical protein
MKDRDDLKTFSSQPVRNHVRRVGNHKLARARDTSGTPEVRELRHTVDSREDGHGHTGRRVGILASDVRPKVTQVTNRTRRPDDDRSPLIERARS